MKELTPELLAHIDKAVDFKGYRNDPDHYPPPISAEALAKAEAWCERELGFPLPAFYRELLSLSNGFMFRGGEFYRVQEEGKKEILNMKNLFFQNLRFRKRRHEPFRIASHLFVFGDFHFQPLVYDTRQGSFHLMSPLFSLKDTRESFSSFSDLGAFLRGILRTREGDAAMLRYDWLTEELSKRLGWLRSRAPARFDPRTLPFLQAVLSRKPYESWRPPAPASAEALAEADRRCEREYGYPLPPFYRDFLRHLNGLDIGAHVFCPIEDPQAAEDRMKASDSLFERIKSFRSSLLFEWIEERIDGDELFFFGEDADGLASYVCHLPSGTFHELESSYVGPGLGGATSSAPDFDSFVKDLFDDAPIPPSEEGTGKEE
ncbi:MAG: SMI1/KNR4 family protein [Methylacidiphilaceae bacterium]|nr:SMI1/KNR4 family protein [Candidatus Methylacidiphilaceae bacterium]